MFFSTAFAQTAGEAPAGPGAIEALLPIVLIFVVFYFLLFRPQQKKMKQHREMLSAIRRGDRIVTGGGIVGTVVKVIDDNELQVEIAENVRVRVHRALISSVLAKTEPVAAGGKDGPGKETTGGSAGKGEAAASAPAGGDAANDSKPASGRASLLKRAFGGKND